MKVSGHCEAKAQRGIYHSLIEVADKQRRLGEVDVKFIDTTFSHARREYNENNVCAVAQAW